jgi:hypothetical protein
LLFLFAVASWAGPYIITNSGEGFAVALDGGEIASNAAIDTVLKAIRLHSEGEDVTIQFGGGGGDTLDLGNTGMVFAQADDVPWGEIALRGSVTAAATGGGGTIYIGANCRVNISAPANIISTTTTTAIDNGGTLEITGGTISGVSQTISNSGTATISGAAVVSAAGKTRNDYVVMNNGTLDIMGGIISADSGAVGIYQNRGSLNISGTAAVVSAEGSAVRLSSGAVLYLNGGTVSSGPNGNAIYVPSEGQSGPSGAIYLGGSPTVNGTIHMSKQEGPFLPIEVQASGGFAFKPGSKTYNIVRTVRTDDYNPLTECEVLIKNGAGFYSNFAWSLSDTAAGFNLAASVNDLVATAGRTYSITFKLNGASGTPPAAIRVVEGGTLGGLAKPSTAPYVSAPTEGCPNGCLNDGEWYVNPQNNDVGAVFDFGGKNIGTDITANTALILNWTTTPVSVLEASRSVPAAQTPGIAAIAPVTVLAGGLTVGPNPVAKRTGAVSFFWSGPNKVLGGKLLVYDVSGKLVKKIPVSATEKGAIASWDLTNAKGAPVSEGTYVAKGIIKTKNGNTEKAAALVSVR